MTAHILHTRPRPASGAATPATRLHAPESPLQRSLLTASHLLELSARTLQKPDRYGALSLASVATGILARAADRLNEELHQAQTALSAPPAQARNYALSIAAQIAAHVAHDARATLDNIGLPEAPATLEARASLDTLSATLDHLTQRLLDLTPEQPQPHPHHHQGRA